MRGRSPVSRRAALARLDWLLSLGQSDAIPDRLARRVRVSNAFALIGAVLTATSTPIDVYGATASLVAIDILVTAAFGSCLVLNARGHRDASRIVLMVAANAGMLGGVLELGGVPELRTVFFPLAIMPFLVFSVSERGRLAAFVALPVAAYFLTAQVPPRHGIALEVNMVYAPVLAFMLLVTCTAVFALIERNAETKLLHARASAAQGARLVALGEMASGIAHEIRNPLAAIHLAAGQVAERREDPAQVTQFAERIQRIVMRASRIIEALRSFARDASGDPFVATPVERIIGDALELVGKRLAERGVELTVGTVPPDLVVDCRSVQLTQVLVNLLGNAYDAVVSADERWVRIDVDRDQTQLELAVSNSGPTIPAEVRVRMFEPFFTTKAPDRGTGIGLSLSRGIVEAHHGTLALDSDAPHTRFVMRIPRAQLRTERAET